MSKESNNEPVPKFEDLHDDWKVKVIETAYGRKLSKRESGVEVLRFTRTFQQMRDMDAIRHKSRAGPRPLKGKVPVGRTDAAVETAAPIPPAGPAKAKKGKT